MLAPAASQPGVDDVLRDPVHHGPVLREKAGSAYLHRLNQDHLAAPAIHALASLRQSLVDVITDHVGRWSLPAHAVRLFGSTARGDGRAGSDVDLLVVRGDDVDKDDQRWEGQLGELTEAVHAWTGDPAEIVEHDRANLCALAASGDSPIADLARDAVVIVGTTPTTFLSTTRAA